MNGLADVVDMGGGDNTVEKELSVGGRPHFMTTYGEGGVGKISDAPHNPTMGGISVDQQPIQGGGAPPSTADKIGSGVSGFFNYMTNFDQKTKCDLLNLAQYSLVGVIPVILMLKFIKNYFPSADESKGSFEVTAECTLEILFILFCIYFIHRLICYVPTYSGIKYEGVNFTQSLLMFLVILFTIQTKLGTKLNILIRRSSNMLEGYTSYGGDTGVESEDATPSMMNSLEAAMVKQPLITQETSFGPQAPIVPSGGPGLPRRQQQQAQGAPQQGGGELAAANDGFSSGGLSGSAW
jgi:hypothetical protein